MAAGASDRPIPADYAALLQPPEINITEADDGQFLRVEMLRIVAVKENENYFRT